MNKFLSHCIIQLLIIVLCFLGLAQALSGLCEAECPCCQVSESIAGQSACCGGDTVMSAVHPHGSNQERVVHVSVQSHSPLHAGDHQQHPDDHGMDHGTGHGMATSQDHAGTKDAEDCQYPELCSMGSEPDLYEVSLATTAGQAKTSFDLATAVLPETAFGFADLFVASEGQRPYQVPILIPPRIYTRICSFLI